MLVYALTVKTMQVGQFKAQFSEVLEQVKGGEEVVISYGRKRENLAVLIPYSAYKKRNRIRLGILQGSAYVSFAKDFEMSDEELVSG